VTTAAANAAQAQYWNGVEAAHWLGHEDRYERMLAPFTGQVLGAAELGRADRVIDLGCGCGATTLAAARVAADGRVLGVDLSRRLLDRARRQRRAAGLGNVRFERADAQVHPFADAGYDAAISRFGVMFFADPLAAFRNVTRALRPGGRLAFACWAGILDNEWIAVPGAAAAPFVDLAALGDPAQPGPFALADPDRLQLLLGRAGLAEVAVQAVAESLLLGSDVPDTAAFLQATGIGRTLLADADAETSGRVAAAVHAALRRYLSADGVRLGSTAWLVTARRPA
jgi:SAM-dependent methyltransferase